MDRPTLVCLHFRLYTQYCMPSSNYETLRRGPQGVRTLFTNVNVVSVNPVLVMVCKSTCNILQRERTQVHSWELYNGAVRVGGGVRVPPDLVGIASKRTRKSLCSFVSPDERSRLGRQSRERCSLLSTAGESMSLSVYACPEVSL